LSAKELEEWAGSAGKKTRVLKTKVRVILVTVSIHQMWSG